MRVGTRLWELGSRASPTLVAARARRCRCSRTCTPWSGTTPSSAVLDGEEVLFVERLSAPSTRSSTTPGSRRGCRCTRRRRAWCCSPTAPRVAPGAGPRGHARTASRRMTITDPGELRRCLAGRPPPGVRALPRASSTSTRRASRCRCATTTGARRRGGVGDRAQRRARPRARPRPAPPRPGDRAPARRREPVSGRASMHENRRTARTAGHRMRTPFRPRRRARILGAWTAPPSTASSSPGRRRPPRASSVLELGAAGRAAGCRTGRPGAHIDLVLAERADPPVLAVRRPLGRRTRYRVGVLREPAGRGGSAYVHDELAAGDPVGLGGPRNNFPLVPVAALPVRRRRHRHHADAADDPPGRPARRRLAAALRRPPPGVDGVPRRARRLRRPRARRARRTSRAARPRRRGSATPRRATPRLLLRARPRCWRAVEAGLRGLAAARAAHRAVRRRRARRAACATPRSRSSSPAPAPPSPSPRRSSVLDAVARRRGRRRCPPAAGHLRHLRDHGPRRRARPPRLPPRRRRARRRRLHVPLRVPRPAPTASSSISDPRRSRR